ncbi:MAG: DUF4105 domain-containing protein [Acetobacter papayae]
MTERPPLHRSILRTLCRGLGLFGILLVAVWGGAAFFYSTLEPTALRLGLSGLFPVALLACLAIRRPLYRRSAMLGISLILAVWFLTDPARNDRDWAPEYSQMADATVEGRVAHVTHIRNFTYRTPTDATPAYYDAYYNLDTLSSVDLVTSYWAGSAIAHVFLSFGFSDGRHLAISIETRRQKRFAYSTIAGFFHHYELFYVAADERDLIGVRTDIRREQVYIYRLQLSPAARERLLLSYLSELHMLTTHPRWYNTLTANCTTEILARSGASPRWRLDWRVLLSGYTASLAYDIGLLDQHDPFATLQRLSLIKRPEGARPSANYSQEIREHLPLNTP